MKRGLFAEAGMLLVLQFPISDGRPFTSGPARLKAPHWTDPLPGEFVRAFGPVQRRLRGVVADFVDERYFASARQALKLPDFGATPWGQVNIGAACAFRRLQSDGGPLARVEIGFRISVSRTPDGQGSPHGAGDATSSDAVDVGRLLTSVLDLPVRIANPDGQTKALALHAAGPALARLFARATTSTKDQVVPALVRAMTPAVLIEYTPRELPTLPSDAQIIDPERTGGVPLAYLHRQHGERPFGVWLLGQTPASAPAGRAVRLALLRVHAEQQVLRHVIALLLDESIRFVRGTREGDLLEAYLNRATTMLPETYPGAQTGKTIANILHASRDPTPADQRARLRELLRGMKRQIVEKLDRYLTAGEQARVNTTAADRPIRVFVSYSRMDEDYVVTTSPKSLLKFLAGLEREGFVFWHDRELYASERWDDRIRQEMDEADIALMLVSQYFLNSTYIADTELPSLLEARRSRGLSIVPLLVSASDWQSHAWLAGTQMLPRKGTLVREYRNRAKRDELYLEVFHTLRRLGTEKRLASH